MQTNFQPDLSATSAIIFKAILGLLFGLCIGAATYFIIMPLIRVYLGLAVLIGMVFAAAWFVAAIRNNSEWSKADYKRRKRLTKQKAIRYMENL